MQQARTRQVVDECAAPPQKPKVFAAFDRAPNERIRWLRLPD
jgi:hypothetical protein